MKTDFHTHVFHPRTAARVLARLQAAYGLAPAGTGLAQDLLDRLRQAGIDRAVVHVSAPGPAQVIPANNLALALMRKHPRLLAFGTVHPGHQGAAAELDRLERAGVSGLKIHAAFQGFALDHAGLGPILEAAAGRFTVLFHAGGPESPPDMLARIHRDFPRLSMVLAHLGGLFQWDQALEHLAGKDVYLDTSSCMGRITDAQLRAILDRHPFERILFGSDYPLFDPGRELERLKTRAGLTDARLEATLTNGRALLEET